MIDLKEDNLESFTGTECYYRHFTRKLVYTDGVKYLAEHGEAYWLIDLVASYQNGPAIAKNERLQEFQLWEVKLVGKGCVVTCREDSNIPPSITQEIEYTDFPFDIKFYVEGGEIGPVMLLRSEH
jgi:hypothetical protein